MARIFVDSGAWIALVNERERVHPRARAYLHAVIERHEQFLTTNYVVQEAATKLRYDAGLAAAVALRKALDGLDKVLRVTWIDARLEREGSEIMEKYADVSLSLTDATSAAVARRAKAKVVFGFDADFRALGFDVQPA